MCVTAGRRGEPDSEAEKSRKSVLESASPQFVVGQTVKMRKSHPCGSDTWVVTRVGGDVGIRCAGCGRRIFLLRRELARRLQASGRAVTRRGDA